MPEVKRPRPDTGPHPVATPSGADCTHVELFISGNAQLMTIHVMGNVVEETCPDFETSLNTARERGGNVVLDLSRVERMDETAAGLLLSLHLELMGEGRQLTLRAPAPQVMETLKLANLDSILTISE